MRGIIVKCNIERVRPASDQEWLGAEVIRVLSADAKASLGRSGQHGFTEAKEEEGPDDATGSSPEQRRGNALNESRDREGEVKKEFCRPFQEIGRLTGQQRGHLIDTNNPHMIPTIRHRVRHRHHRHHLLPTRHPSDRPNQLMVRLSVLEWKGVLLPSHWTEHYRP